MNHPTEQEEGSAGLPFDLLDDTMDTLSEAVLDCMPSPPDSAALYRQLGLSDGPDHLGLDLSSGAYGMETGAAPDTQVGVPWDPPPAPSMDMFVMPAAPGDSKAEPPGQDEIHRRTSDESMQSAEKSNKKHAPLGQWLTPPQLLYYGSLKKNKSELDVPSTGGLPMAPMMSTGGAQHTNPSTNPSGMQQGLGATFPMAPPYAIPMPPPSSSSFSMPPPNPPHAPAFPANFRPPPPGSLPRSVSFEGLTQHSSYSLHNMGMPVMLPYPSIVQMQGAMAYHTPQGMAMMVQPPQQPEGGSQPAQGDMPPPPARLGQGRRYQGINPPTGDPMFGGLSMTGLGRGPMQLGANATGAGGQADVGSLRRQTLSCPDLTNIGMRPMGMLPGNAESMARTTTTESSGASSTFGPYTPLPPFSALQAQGLLSPLMADDLSSYGRAMGACPDFQRAMAGNLKPGSEEEDRRQKRLARNRAAARLRRQRKKNLVDTYEQEVALLEANLKRLTEHEWGSNDGTLQDVLGRAKVLDMLTLDEAREATDSLLRDQMALLQPLKHDASALDVLAAALCLDDSEGMGEEEKQQLTELRGQLMRDLELTSEQVAQLQSVLGPEPCVDELASIEEIERGLERLRTGSDECLQQAELCQGMVRTGFEKAQLRRFLGWADTNRESVEQLDYGGQASPAPASSGQMKADPDAPSNDDRKPAAKASSKQQESQQGSEEQQAPVFHFFGEFSHSGPS